MIPFHRINKPFKLLGSWFHHENFEKVVEDSWDNSRDFHSNLSNFTENANIWNCDVYKNIFHTKKIIKACLEHIQIAQENSYSHSLDILERNLKKKWQDILKHERNG